MPDFSVLIPETHRNIFPGSMDTLIQTRREELFTGLMRLGYPSGENLVFSFLEGAQQKLYRCFENTIAVIPRQTWPDSLDHRSATVGFLHLPTEAMRFVRIAHEAPVIRLEHFTFSPQALLKNAEKWSVDQDPGIVQIEAENIKTYYLIAGRSTPIIEELSFAEGEARFNISDATFPQRLPKTDYFVTRFASNREHDVWREFELRLAFTPLMRMLLNRFSELAGRVLTERLCEQLSLWARQGGWKITITSNGAVNRHYFDLLQTAIEVYTDLLRRFRQEAIPAIGSRMVDGMVGEVLDRLDPYRRELLVQHIYSRSGVGGLTGVVWR